MAIAPFVFSSHTLPKLKARQLSKTFRFLKLSVAQEATARALGYHSWYECTHRGTAGQPSPSDQEAGLSVRTARYYHQAGVLHSIGIAPADADRWVRAWGLTGEPTLSRRNGAPLFFNWENMFEAVELGEITEEDVLAVFEKGVSSSKYPEIDRPQRICPGVILGPWGRYPHFAVDPALYRKIPAYFLGSKNLFHIEDDQELLAAYVPGFRRTVPGLMPEPPLSRVAYEWHHGDVHPKFEGEPCVPRLAAAALSRPEAQFVISRRYMPCPGGYDFGRSVLACLRGKDFAEFMLQKGVLDISRVIWFEDRATPVAEAALDEFTDWLLGYGGQVPLPVVDISKGLVAIPPLYSYPFMAAPMSDSEYAGDQELNSLLPLHEDYPDEDDDDDEDDECDVDPPKGPAPRVLEPA